MKVAGLAEAHPFLVAQDRALKVQGILPPFLVNSMKFPLTCALNHVDGYVARRVGAEKYFWFSHLISINYLLWLTCTATRTYHLEEKV